MLLASVETSAAVMRLALSLPSVSATTARRSPAWSREAAAGLGDRVEQRRRAERPAHGVQLREDVAGRGGERLHFAQFLVEHVEAGLVDAGLEPAQQVEGVLARRRALGGDVHAAAEVHEQPEADRARSVRNSSILRGVPESMSSKSGRAKTGDELALTVAYCDVEGNAVHAAAERRLRRGRLALRLALRPRRSRIRSAATTMRRARLLGTTSMTSTSLPTPEARNRAKTGVF